jgi:hypothetical protein
MTRRARLTTRTCAAIIGLLVAQVPSLSAQVRPVDAEAALAKVGFTPAEIAQARGGQGVAKLLKSDGPTDIGVYGAIKIDAKADRLIYWFNDVAAFRHAAELGVARRLSNPPVIGDFADLSVDADDVAAIRACRPGRCDLKLGDLAMQRFQTGVDWSAPDAGARANDVMRLFLLQLAQAYLKGGDAQLGAAHDEKAPRAAADEFHQVLWKSKTLYEIAAPFATYLDEFPTAQLPGSEQFLYWAKNTPGSSPSISLHQMVTYHAPSGAVFLADKQLFASRYTDASLLVISLASTPDKAGFYALVGARASSTLLSGVAARVLRRTVENATRDTVKMYLEWLRASMMQ